MSASIVQVGSPVESSKSMTPVVHKSGVVSVLSSKKLWAALGVAALVAVGIAVPVALRKHNSSTSTFQTSANSQTTSHESCSLNGDFYEISVSSKVNCAERTFANSVEVAQVDNGKVYFLDGEDAATQSNGGFNVTLYSSYDNTTMTCVSEISQIWCGVASERAMEYEGN
eukprot:TRINITY_DN908_c0_g2_i1.p1 TRINITY_DN908_c0_g2~~TRINITY_DN908_c0_g2_i1.p1  ORF type:complete len:170 (+),score=45.98 TRINITY_DN908_c0_g2_i1:205-714(+)